jgi:hypothetical protein
VLTCAACPAPCLGAQAQIIASQPAERQAHLATCLGKLMTDVQRTLESKNRDKFTQVGRREAEHSGMRRCIPAFSPLLTLSLPLPHLLQNLTVVRHEYRSKN